MATPVRKIIRDKRNKLEKPDITKVTTTTIDVEREFLVVTDSVIKR